MPVCAFLTIEDIADFIDDDELCFGPLEQLGWTIERIVWTAKVDWNQFDVVLIRSVWDYHLHHEKFLKVVREIENSTATLMNSGKIVEWNIDKGYLLDLQSKDVAIVPTLRFEHLDRQDIKEAFSRFKADRMILKPMISASAVDTFKVGVGASLDRIDEICNAFSNRPCLAQPFMDFVQSEGEFSLVYFNGELSHTVLKTVQAGDFRVQEEYGGGVVTVSEPEAELVKAADGLMALLDETPLYARVDLVRTSGGSFALMELELIEPALFFRFSKESASRFANAVDQRFRVGA